MFANNIQYIRWNDLLHNFKVSLSKLADSKRADPGRQNSWIITQKNQSYHIFALIAYHYCSTIEELKILLPDHILYHREIAVEQMYGQDLYIFDDVSYSGGSLIMLIINLLKIHKQHYSGKIIRFNICLGYATPLVFKNYKRFLQPMVGGGLYCRVRFEYSVLLTSLAEELGERDATIVRLLFNPGSYNGDSIIYCDHKLADPVSTYSLTLQYGLVPPSKINYDLLKELKQQECGDCSEYLHYEYLIEAGIGLGETTDWSCVPFIEGCTEPLPKSITDRSWEMLILYPCIHEAPKGIGPQLTLIQDDLGEESLKMEYHKVVFARNYRCPKSFYQQLKFEPKVVA
jgi:hypothetical protein